MHKTIYNYVEVDKLPNCLCAIPYYGGESTAVHASRATNPIYYLKTYFSMIRYFDRVITFVNNKRDRDFIAGMPGSPEVIQIECDPIYLPVSLMGHIQKNHEKFDFEYMFYTEADQILYCSTIKDMAAKCSDTEYVVPHRIVKLPISDRPFFTTRKVAYPSPIIIFNNQPYEIRLYVDRINTENNRFYQVKNHRRAFGGSWLSNRNLFLKTAFKFVDYQPIEEACFSMFTNERIMYRTHDPFDFFVDHLSGYEQVARDSGYNILSLPGGW